MRSALAALAVLFLVSPAVAQKPIPVDLELALAVDVSGSVDDVEAALQRDGYIRAFRDPAVIKAITNGILGRIAVAYYEWAGFGHMKIIAPWTLIENARDAEAFAEALTKIPPQTARRTAISAAIAFAVPFFDRNRFEGTRRVVDISGDGPNNWGGLVSRARDAAVAAGVTINGLPIVNERYSRFGTAPFQGLDLYYRDCVIGGPGAFIVVARDFRDFARAVRRKLILEIAGRIPTRTQPSIVRVQSRPSPPCNAGEMRMRGIEDF